MIWRILIPLGLLLLALPAGAQECPARLMFHNGLVGATDLDLGFSGMSHDIDVQSDSTVTVGLASCAGSYPTCGICNVSGPIPNQGENAGTIANRRCYSDPSIRCTGDIDCPASVTCVFHFGGPMPIPGGGVPICVLNTLSDITGTVNVDTADLVATATVASRVWTGPSVAAPCPTCEGDGTANDGSRGGTCVGGARSGLACDTVGVHVDHGGLSLDCPPTGASTAELDLALPLVTAPTSVTLTASHPSCSAAGFTGVRCFCDTCATLDAEPCFTDADCPATTTCGGLRCLGGASAGTPCAAQSDCPSSVCSKVGSATQPTDCTLASGCDATSGDEGVCTFGPFNGNCVLEPFRSCLSPSDCPVAGDSCLFAAQECFVTDGSVSDVVTATGSATAPVGGEADVTLAALFCVAPTGTALVDSTAGLPGLGRLEMGGTLTALAAATSTRRVIIARRQP